MLPPSPPSFFFFFNDTATTEIYTLSLHDALPIWRLSRHRQRHRGIARGADARGGRRRRRADQGRSEEHTSELQSPDHLVCRLLLEKKKKRTLHIVQTSTLWRHSYRGTSSIAGVES